MRRPFGSGVVRQECYVEGCSRPQRNKGKATSGATYYGKFCNHHHRKLYELGTDIGKQKIPNGKCENCGWDKAPCDRHRIIPQKGYLPENIKILCPNCHRLVTLGLLVI